jgi:hypothetical protein
MNDPAIIGSRIREFVGKKMQIVLNDSTSFFGQLEAVNDKGIVLQNMRNKKTNYTLNSISEIYIDVIV